MTGILEQLLTPFLAIAAITYCVLAVRIARASPQHSNSMVSFFFVLVAGMIAGSAFSYGASDAGMYGIGRVLSFSSAGFIPLVMYIIYRDYTIGPPPMTFIVVFALVPIVTTVLAFTNSFHNLIWLAVETPTGLQVSPIRDHFWYQRIYAPATYGLFFYSMLALIGRLPSIAPVHRRTLLVLLLCALLPFVVSVSNVFFGIGASDFPFTSTTLALLLPVFAHAGIRLGAHEFSPLAYQTLFNHVRDPIFVIDREQHIICANVAAQNLLQGSEGELVGRKLWEDFPAARAILEQAKELDLTQTLRMDANSIYEVSVGPLKGSKGQDAGMVVVCRDVTERRLALSKLAESEQLVRTLIETSSNGILRFARNENNSDNSYRCVFANRAAESFLGGANGTLTGMPLTKLEQLNPPKLLEHFDHDTPAGAQITFEVAGKCGRGENWLRIVGEPVGDDFSVTVLDITQRKREEDKMLADALRDPLTGVLNRRGFELEATERIRSSSTGAVLYFDLNQFKAVNDEFGHQAGDALLKAFGHRLESCLRPEDVLGRLGGDEFAIVLPEVSVADVRHIAKRLVQTAAEAYILEGQEITCSASVGIALMPKHGEELWHLLSVADQAMYIAKRIPEEEAANDRAAYVDAAMAS